MTTIKSIEQEVNKIRLEIYEETKNMTLEQRKERLEKIINGVQKEFNLNRISRVAEDLTDIAIAREEYFRGETIKDEDINWD